MHAANIDLYQMYIWTSCIIHLTVLKRLIWYCNGHLEPHVTTSFCCMKHEANIDVWGRGGGYINIHECMVLVSNYGSGPGWGGGI